MMKRTLLILSMPLLLAACIDKNPIDENAAKVWDWYSSQWENPVSPDVISECGNAVMVGKSSDPACEAFAAKMTQKLNASSVLDEQVEDADWYSKNFWAKWQADSAEKQRFKEQFDKLNKNSPWSKK